MAASKREEIRLFVAGRIDDYRYHLAVNLGERLADQFEHITLGTRALLEVDWIEYIAQKSKDLRGRAYDHRTSPIIFHNDTEYIGNESDFLTWARIRFRYKTEHNMLTFKHRARAAYLKWLEKSRNQFCYFDLKHGRKSVGRVTFELYVNICPKTCENFKALCTGECGTSKKGIKLGYKDTVIHRVVPGGWIQGGDVCSGKGDSGESIYGGNFPDENFAVKHDRPGILAMAGGDRHSNNSQFYIALQAHPWLDKKRVAFGRVVSGVRNLRLLEQCKTVNQRPKVPITIANCGLVLLDGSAAPHLSEAQLMQSDGRRLITKVALLKHIFAEVDSIGVGRVRHQDLLVALRAPDGMIKKNFPAQAKQIIKLVTDYTAGLSQSSPPRALISRNEFVDLALAVIQKVDPESVSKDSVLYRATHKASILGFDPDEEKRKALFGVLSQEDMDRVKALFNHLLDQSEIGEGMLEVDLISEVASAMPIDFGAYMGKDNEDKALNLEEAYGYFNACKRQNRQGFEDALSAVEEDEGVLEPAKTEASASK